VPPNVGAIDAPPSTDDVPKVTPPKPWIDRLDACACAVAGTAQTATIAERIRTLRIFRTPTLALAIGAMQVPRCSEEKPQENG
jgi:hypothetical protein